MTCALKWDAKNRKRLHELLEIKLLDIACRNKDYWRSVGVVWPKREVSESCWSAFSASVRIVEDVPEYRRTCVVQQFLLDQRENDFGRFFDEFGIRYVPYPSRRKNHVVIINPWFGTKAMSGPEGGLSVPEEVALKFMVIGIP
jgi:hypothetical protein